MPESRQPTKTKVVSPRLKNCAFCSNKLQFKYKQDEKTVYRLDETVEVRRNAYSCTNDQCRKSDEVITGPRQGLKYSSIGWDLLAEIGILRVDKTKTLEDIQGNLREVHKIDLSIKQISNLADMYLQLIRNKPHPTLINNLRSRGNCILSIDGAKPEKANCILYIIREEVSGRILLARTINSSDSDTLSSLLREIKAMQLPLVGIVSDKQRSIVLAVEEVFPDVDYQFCQYHFLKNVSDDFKTRDRGLRKKIRKDLKPIYNTHKTAQRQLKRGDLSDEEFEIIDNLYLMIKASSRKSPKYPFKPVGLELYRNIYHLETAVKDMQSHKPINFFRTIIRHTTSIRTNYRTSYKVAKTQFDRICEIEDLLDVGEDRLEKYKASEKDLEELVDDLGSELITYVDQQIESLDKTNRIDDELQEWWAKVRRLTETHIDGLFEYCKDENLPRTNNGMEHYIKDLKSDLYRILNRKYIHKFMLRRAEFWVFAKDLEGLGNEKIIERLKENGDYITSDQKIRFEKLQDQFRMSRLVRKNFKRAVNELVEEWKGLD